MRKFYLFCILCVVFSLQFCLSQETKLTIAPVNSQQSVNSYLVNDSGSINIDLNTLPSGLYQVLLITNGVVQDAKTIYKN